MAKAINQNDLVNIINAHITAISDIMTIIIKNIHKNQEITDPFIKDEMTKVRDNIAVAFGKDGLIDLVCNAVKVSQGIADKEKIKNAEKSVNLLIKFLKKNVKKIKKISAIKLNAATIDDVNANITFLLKTLTLIQNLVKIDVSGAKRKIKSFRKAIKHLLKLILWITNGEIKDKVSGKLKITEVLDKVKDVTTKFTVLNVFVKSLVDTFTALSSIKIGQILMSYIKIPLIKFFIKKLLKLITFIKTKLEESPINDVEALLDSIINCTNSIVEIIEAFIELKLKDIIVAWIKVKLIKNVFKGIFSLLKFVESNPVNEQLYEQIMLIKRCVKQLLKIILKFAKSKKTISVWIKVKIIKNIFNTLKKILINVSQLRIEGLVDKFFQINIIAKLIKSIIKRLNKSGGLITLSRLIKKLGKIVKILGNPKETLKPNEGSIHAIITAVRRLKIKKAIVKMRQLVVFTTLLKITIKNIIKIPAGRKVSKKLSKLSKIFGGKKLSGGNQKGTLNSIVRGASHLASTRRAKKKLLKVAKFALILGQVLLIFLLLVPMVVLFAIGAPLLLLGIFCLSKVLKIISKMVKRINAKLFLSILKLTIIVGALVLLGLGLWFLGVIATKIIDSIAGIFMFFGIVLGLCLLLSIFALVAPMVLALITPVLLLIGAIALIVLLMLGIGFFLMLLTKLELDKDLVIQAVKDIMECAWCIISNVFAQDDEDAESTDKGFAEKLIGWVLSGLGAILVAILAVAYIALIFIAVSFILLIALELRLLQELDLKPDKIKENVKIVLTTAQDIINDIFEPEENEEKKSDRTYLEAVLEHIGSGLVMIVQAIMAVIYLALITFAIMMILVISGMLRLLQELELDEEKITTNVNLVFKTAEQVVSSVFDPEDDKDNPSKKDWVADAIEYFFGGLAKILLAIMAIAYLALIMVSIALITGIAGMLRGLQEIKLENAIIKDRVKLVCETANLVIDTLFDYRDDKDNPSKKGFLRSLFSWIGLGPLIKILDAIMAIAYLALISACIGIIKTIAENLMTICDVDFSNIDIKQKVQDILDAAAEVMSAVFDHKDPKEKPLDSKWDNFCETFLGKERFAAYRMLGWLSFISAATAAIADMANNMTTIFNGVKVPDVKQITTLVTSISTAVNDIMSLFSTSAIVNDKFYVNQYGTILRDSGGDAPSGFQKKDWTDMATQLVRNLNGEEGGDAGINTVIKTLCDFAENISKVTEYSWAKSIQTRDASGKKITPPYLSVIKGILHIPIDVITTISEAANELDKYDLKDYNTNMDKFDAIMNRVWDILGTDPKKMEKDNTNLESRIKMVKEHTDNLIKFMDKISSMDLTKMQTAENLFKHMAEFSTSINGNFDKLAEALNDKIAPLLEEFNGLLKETPQKISANMNELLGLDDTGSTSDTNTGNNTDVSKSVVSFGIQTGKGATGNTTQGQGKGKGTTQQSGHKAKKNGATIQDIYDVLVGQGDFTQGVKVHNS